MGHIINAGLLLVRVVQAFTNKDFRGILMGRSSPTECELTEIVTLSKHLPLAGSRFDLARSDRHHVCDNFVPDVPCSPDVP